MSVACDAVYLLFLSYKIVQCAESLFLYLLTFLCRLFPSVHLFCSLSFADYILAMRPNERVAFVVYFSHQLNIWFAVNLFLVHDSASCVVPEIHCTELIHCAWSIEEHLRELNTQTPNRMYEPTLGKWVNWMKLSAVHVSSFGFGCVGRA